MPDVIKRDDLRTIKTENALNIAIMELLHSTSFDKITVRDICEQAQVSRSTFYAHFTDKFDLLKYWISRLSLFPVGDHTTYEQVEETINDFLENNKTVVKNLMNSSDRETFRTVFESVTAVLGSHIPNDPSGLHRIWEIVLSSFFTGGLIAYLAWHTANDFPADVPLMNTQIYTTMNKLKSIAVEFTS